jgi:hypothetical protein
MLVAIKFDKTHLPIKNNILTIQTYKIKSILTLITTLGTLLFVVLYVVATLLYPGGSQVDKNSVGFSWINNYWCNLLNENTINGQHNPAKPVAMIGMFILCLSLIFWFLFPRQINVSRNLKLIIQISGTLAMTIVFFLFTNINHDLVTNLASIFGLIAMSGVFIGLYKTKWLQLFTFGLLNILLVVLNNYVYYTKGLVIYLPIIQRISFAAFLTWICCIDINLFHMTEKNSYHNSPGGKLANSGHST